MTNEQADEIRTDEVHNLLRSLWAQGQPLPCVHCTEFYTGNHSWYRFNVIILPDRGSVPGATEVAIDLADGPLCPYCFAMQINMPDDRLQGPES